jgi:hypothetical protein
MAGTNDGHLNSLHEAASKPSEGITTAKPSDSPDTNADRVTPPDHAVFSESNSTRGASAMPLPAQAARRRPQVDSLIVHIPN